MTLETTPLVRADGLDLSIGGRRILAHVDLSIGPGEIITLIGPNGAGKSTLVRVLLGLIRPDHGKVSRRSGLRIGYLPQKFSIDQVLPLRVARLMTLTCRAAHAEIEAALAETGVAHLIAAQVQTLSGGELQRVLLARALLSNPDLLVLDEPVQGVDFGGQAELYRLISDIRDRRGCAILMVSHDLHLVMAATDRVLCLNQHLCCAGTPAMVARDPEYLRLFGPRAAEAFALYAHGPHGHDHVHTLSGDVAPVDIDHQVHVHDH
ncbi:MAG: zinc ABC transporter ATP-binding protein ZnuC [Alphaproteobacteria bacterium]